jgi:natural product precursor
MKKLSKLKLNHLVDSQLDNKGLKTLFGGASCSATYGECGSDANACTNLIMQRLRNNNGY